MSLNRERDNERRKQTRVIAAIKRAAIKEATEALTHRHHAEYEKLVSRAESELMADAQEDGLI